MPKQPVGGAPLCCERPMAKAGFAWSGRHKRQLYRCSQCGRRTTKQTPKGFEKETK